MSRQQKFPDTPTFHYFNANPKKRITTDCVVRALCVGLEQDYNQTVMELAEMQCETGYDDGDAKLYDKYLQSKGWRKVKQPKKDDGSKYTGKEFCEQLQSDPWMFTGIENDYNAKIIAHIGGHHIVAIVCGKVWDTWNCTGKCIGNYWTKE